MLGYIRRADLESSTPKQQAPDVSIFEHPIIGYCNWSFAKKKHITEHQLEEALRNFKHKYIPFYVRLFDETPADILNDFVQVHAITNDEMESVFQSTRQFIRRPISRGFFEYRKNVF